MSGPRPDLVASPGQTIGPFYGYSLPYAGGADLVPRGHPGAVRLHGTVRDGAGEPVPDALLEIWQADAAGDVVRQPGSLHRDGWTFTGFGRTEVDAEGRYSFTTVVPGAAPGQAPFVAMTVFARGLLDRLSTRVYLPGDDAALAVDPLLSSLPEDRRATLVARADDDGFVHDLWLQEGGGGPETVFLRYPGA